MNAWLALLGYIGQVIWVWFWVWFAVTTASTVVRARRPLSIPRARLLA